MPILIVKNPTYDLVVKSRNKQRERVIPAHKFVIDIGTEKGEDADLYELMPHDGLRLINPDQILRRVPKA